MRILSVGFLALFMFTVCVHLKADVPSTLTNTPSIPHTPTNYIDETILWAYQILSTNTVAYIYTESITICGEVTTSITTNWTLTSRTFQEFDLATESLVYHPVGFNYTGSILSNTVATLQWRGSNVVVVLESVEIGTCNRTEWK